LGVFQGACDVLESAAPMVNYDLTGLKFVATKNPNIINSVKEISLEYQFYPAPRGTRELEYDAVYEDDGELPGIERFN
jgi:hypothetical protein